MNSNRTLHTAIEACCGQQSKFEDGTNITAHTFPRRTRHKDSCVVYSGKGQRCSPEGPGFRESIVNSGQILKQQKITINYL